MYTRAHAHTHIHTHTHTHTHTHVLKFTWHAWLRALQSSLGTSYVDNCHSNCDPLFVVTHARSYRVIVFSFHMCGACSCNTIYWIIQLLAWCYLSRLHCIIIGAVYVCHFINVLVWSQEITCVKRPPLCISQFESLWSIYHYISHLLCTFKVWCTAAMLTPGSSHIPSLSNCIGASKKEV